MIHCDEGGAARWDVATADDAIVKEALAEHARHQKHVRTDRLLARNESQPQQITERRAESQLERATHGAHPCAGDLGADLARVRRSGGDEHRRVGGISRRVASQRRRGGRRAVALSCRRRIVEQHGHGTGVGVVAHLLVELAERLVRGAARETLRAHLGSQLGERELARPA